MKEHCFHQQGLIYLTYPSFHYEVCCHCGKKRRVGGRLVPVEDAGHGTKAGDGYIEVPDVEDVGACEPPVEPT